MTEFTPGPWDGNRKHPNDCIAYIDGGYENGVPTEICVMYRGGKSKEEFLANKNLILAAPDMYEACKKALELMTRANKNQPRQGMEEEYAIALAALKKAREGDEA